MTATVHKLKSVAVVGEGLGDCASRTVATHEPGQSSLSRPLRVSVNYRSGRAVVAPTFICRTLKPPKPFGHRQWLKLEGR